MQQHNQRLQPIRVRSRITFTPENAPTRIDVEIDRINIAEVVYGVDPKPLPAAYLRRTPARWNRD